MKLPGEGFRLTELERRLANMFRAGRIASVDPGAARAVVISGDPDGEHITTPPRPWLSSRAGADREWWAPEPGEQVLLLCPSGDPAQAWILPAAFSNANPANGDRASVHRTTYKDGAVVEYDREAHKLTATLPEGGTAEVTASGGVTVTGPVHIIGDVSVEGLIHATDDIISASISLQQHVHGGVYPGGGVTGVPQ